MSCGFGVADYIGEWERMEKGWRCARGMGVESVGIQILGPIPGSDDRLHKLHAVISPTPLCTSSPRGLAQYYVRDEIQGEQSM